MNSDLISREELLKRIDEEREYLKSRGQFGAEHILVHNFRDLVENAPTVDAIVNTIEVRSQGEWIFKNGKYRCSQCGEKAIYRFSGSLSVAQTELLTKFCPSCGADMRKTESARPDTISCFNCKHFRKQISDNPCYVCNKQFSEWEAGNETNSESEEK